MVPKEANEVGFRGCRDEDVFYGQRTDTVNAGRTALSHQCSTEQWQKTHNKNNPTPKADPAMKMASWGQGLLRLEDQELLAPRNTGPAEAARAQVTRGHLRAHPPVTGPACTGPKGTSGYEALDAVRARGPVAGHKQISSFPSLKRKAAHRPCVKKGTCVKITTATHAS